jgi:hypothetical protein
VANLTRLYQELAAARTRAEAIEVLRHGKIEFAGMHHRMREKIYEKIADIIAEKEERDAEAKGED